MATPKLKARGKPIAAKQPKFPGYEPANKPAVKIMKCIGFQKFRYFGENRPGKKYQDKDFLQLALYHMSGKNVRIQIVCFDTERQHEIHPNGLVGRDCEYGVYGKTFPISKVTQIIRIPYLRTERILTKKTKQDEGNKMGTVFAERAKILPYPYNEQCMNQARMEQKYDTTRVCFGIIVTIEDSPHEPLFCLSNVVQNASEKTMLRILKLSTQFVSAQEGGEIDIFTSEDGPPITAGKCSVKVIISTNEGELLWESPDYTPAQDQILYKRVVTYRVPPYGRNPAVDSPVRGCIALSCMQSGQTCSMDFCYEPGANSARKLATVHSNKPPRKRPYVAEPSDDENRNADDIKWRVKEKVKSRQIQESGDQSVLDLSRQEAVTNSQTLSVTNGVASFLPMATDQDTVPLHQQEDIVLAKDMVTGEVVYIRTPQAQPTQDVVYYVQDGPQTLSSLGGFTMLSEAPRAVPVPTSELDLGASTSVSTTTTATLRTLGVPQNVRRPSSDHTAGPSTRKKYKFESPWIVSEPENMPLVNGDISFDQSKLEVTVANATHAVPVSEQELKREPVEMGPPILTPGHNVQISSETVPGVSNNLPSGTLISSANLPSLGSLLANGVLDGVKFDETGTLLSSSVFEMVKPYM